MMLFFCCCFFPETFHGKFGQNRVSNRLNVAFVVLVIVVAFVVAVHDVVVIVVVDPTNLPLKFG